ncbi:membrane protein [[Pantoea] beijingensis]|uniref:Membrane protein n=1 Tax=[Pantoea] beijingensis TaxID=1324864 RepID=A0A443IDQ2_9GAMM|nr:MULTISPECIES: lysine exporter LysO family protein [Erwiniaceae]RWR02046.1 membrane protein [[Pantoea] beijingensis]
MYSGLLIILLPLVMGYLVPSRGPALLRLVNQLLSSMVYVILFFMGIGLAFLDNLSRNLLAILHYSAVSVICIMTCSLLALALLEKRRPWHHPHKKEKLPSRIHMALDSLKLCGVLVSGFLLGLSDWAPLHFAPRASEYALYFLLFLVGLQLRGSGMSLRQILLNRRGTLVAMVACFGALTGGLLTALLLGLPLKTGLAIASGFGWYSLSGIMMTEAFGPVIGSAAFFSDLIRELLAIMLIPGLIQTHRSMALGISGATSMDFTLPVLQRSGGIEIVPAAIVHGFILSLLAPLLIALFST